MVRTPAARCELEDGLRELRAQRLSRELRPRDVPPLAAHSPRVDEQRNKTYSEINDPSGYLGLCYDNKIGDSLYGKSNLPRVLNRDGSPNRVNTIANAYPNWVTTMLGDTARIAIFLPDGPRAGNTGGRHLLRPGRGGRSHVAQGQATCPALGNPGT